MTFFSHVRVQWETLCDPELPPLWRYSPPVLGALGATIGASFGEGFSLPYWAVCLIALLGAITGLVHGMKAQDYHRRMVWEIKARERRERHAQGLH